MGTFSVPIYIGDERRRNWTRVEALVDTGAFVSALPASMLRSLGVTPTIRQDFRFGQGEVRRMNVGQTWVRVAGREAITQVLFNEEGTTPLLGAFTLEAVYMGVDPVEQRLIPLEAPVM